MQCSHDITATTGAAPQIFATAFNFFAASQCLSYPEFRSDVVDNDLMFDFIIVGGGSAGSVVANRLSEVKHWKILLLEAGPAPPIESSIPNLDVTLLETKYDWNYYTEHIAPSECGGSKRKIPWPRGKMLGGCSSINGMIYIRGRPDDYQKWVEAGNPSWNWNNVTKYFRKAESLQSKRLLNDHLSNEIYGHHGPLIIDNYNSTYRKYTNCVLNAFDELGVRKVNDINTVLDVQGKGYAGIYTATVSSGRRQSTYETYLKSVRGRENLKIITNALVNRILINDSSVAYGVEVEINGKIMTYLASKEVIVSTGTINTPKLLMLSGIGPQKHLTSKGILCRKDLPVGQNLQDHNMVPIFIYGDEPGTLDEAQRRYEEIRYLVDGSGYLGQVSFSDITAFFSRYDNMSMPEFQSHFVLLFKNTTQNSNKRFMSYSRSVQRSIIEFNSKKAMYLFTVHLLHPFSKGSIYLNTSHPNYDPIIDANYFNDPRDLQAIADSIHMLTKIINSQYFRSINAFVHKINLPECEEFDFQSDPYWKCYANSMLLTLYHPVGTAKMGPDPSDSVVDNYLRVHGVRGLRVIDASVMPGLTSGNTNGPTIMIGEMGADMIKADYHEDIARW
ncbi:glucose dehydrogenase [FAD, quinone]-like [Colias croceus]|uniref:glucose dehydrogenase [FAD, quinone]-like n=1 Tax=Colias crocea TaxID=72248 RepID=UPI001E27D545|nr:glucose dehydrogenase [FAD, quinone]-like [Colias croceus]